MSYTCDIYIPATCARCGKTFSVDNGHYLGKVWFCARCVIQELLARITALEDHRP